MKKIKEVKNKLFIIGLFMSTLSIAQVSPTTITFEPNAGTGTSLPPYITNQTQAVNNAYFQAEYGIQFFHQSPTSGLLLPRIGQMGGSVQFWNSAFPTTYNVSGCSFSGQQTNVLLQSAFSPADKYGCFFLARAQGISPITTNPMLWIEYDNAILTCSSLALSLLDIDGGERWIVEVHATDGSVTSVASCTPSASTWAVADCDFTGGDRLPTEINVDISPKIIDYVTFSFDATHISSGPGFAMDNFQFCPINNCPAAIDTQYVHINSNITYTSDQIWDNKYYIDDNVIVTVANGAVLDITNVDVVFGECAGITFQDQAYLRSNNSVYRPCAVDGTWRGLLFDGSQGQGTFDNIINQSTFKNAEVALYFMSGADGVITDNLFSNCNNGVRVEDNNDFNHSITGNRFVVEQFYPVYNGCYPFTNNVSSFGIISIATKFSQQVSQNEFVNSKGTQLELIGIHQTSGGGIFTSNIFTDYTSSITSISPQFYTGIENNTIEVNVPGINSFFNSTSIFIDGANGPLVEINNNEINNNENQFPSLFAIGARNATNISISNNEIEGFNYGVIVFGQSHKYQITENRIQNTLAIGVIAVSVGNDQNFITCNEIKMKTFNNTIGIHHFNMSSTSEITSNCITDCSTPINLIRFGGATLPKVRNNYLYNYNNVGINVTGYSGNIGTVGDPGMNTLWSNDNSAVDIQSTTNITVADNFGMFNIGFPQVQITSNNPYHSTASCGNQIFNMPSQGNLNTNYSCDHIQSVDGLLIGSGGTFALANNYLSKLSNSTNQYADANVVLATYDNADVNMLNDIITNTSLTANETALLKYNFYYRNSDYITARSNLNLFNPNSTDEADFKTLRMYDIDVLTNDWTVLLVNDIQQIENIKIKESINANFAVSLLNNTSTYRDYIIDLPEITNVLKTSNVKHIENIESYLNVYPSPSSSMVYVELINNDSNGKIQLFDLAGKLVNNYEINIVAGRIEININNLTAGLYFITLTDSETGFKQKGKVIKIEN